MSRKEWSLAGRLTRLFLVTTTFFVVVLSSASIWFLDRSTERELGGLLREEIEELDAKFTHSSRDTAAFEAITAELAAHHPASPLAWRVWLDGEVWGEFGRTGMLSAETPSRLSRGRVHEADGALRWFTQQLATGHEVGLVLDGSAQLGPLKHYVALTVVCLLSSLVLALVVGRVFFRRVSQLLTEVARRARSVHSADAEVDFDLTDAPQEIRGITLAFDQMLENIRAERARARVFTAGLAHELRSPVQNLIGETEVALIADRDGAQYRSVLRSHGEELHDLANAIDNLVAICSDRAARESGAREDFDLGEEAEIRLRRENAVAERRGVHLDVAHRGDLRLFGDREAILRAVRNLIANAIEWSPPGSTVHAELRGEPNLVVITVDDAGPGVPTHLRTQIFEPFFRGPDVGHRRIGYGLGLGMVRSAVRNQGGSVEVESSPQGGARFKMVLPRDGSEDPSADEGPDSLVA